MRPERVTEPQRRVSNAAQAAAAASVPAVRPAARVHGQSGWRCHSATGSVQHERLGATDSCSELPVTWILGLRPVDRNSWAGLGGIAKPLRLGQRKCPG